MLEEWLPFLGRLHPVLVHAPIGVLLAIVILAVASPLGRREGFRTVERILLWVLVFTSLAAMGAGVALVETGDYAGGLMNTHRVLGFITVFAVFFALALHHYQRRWPYVLALLVTVGVTGATGHYGGSLTHGRGYLANALPENWQAYFRLAPPVEYAEEEEAPEPELETVEEARLYHDVVQPILASRCYTCHGSDRVEGGLRLDSFEAIMAGGDSGSIVTAGQPHQSELIRRLHLPLADDERMPPEGRTQPTSDEIAVLQWWVSVGAPDEDALAEYRGQAPAQVAAYLSDRFPEDEAALADAEPDAEEAGETDIAEIHQQAYALAEELGIIIQPVARDESDLRVSADQAGEAFGDEELARLEPIQQHIRRLELSGTGITDAALEQISGMRRLERLTLSRTAVTDEGIPHLGGLPDLRYLNLYGSPVTDESLDVIGMFPALERVYLWETDVSPEAAEALAEQAEERAAPRVRELRERIAALERELDRQGLRVELGADLAVFAELAEAEEGDAPINSECPITGADINADFTTEHEGHVIAFCCGDCLAQFEEDPSAHAEEVDALIAAAESPDGDAPVNSECPFTGASASADFTAEYEGHVIAFCCGDCLTRFEDDPEAHAGELADILPSGEADSAEDAADDTVAGGPINSTCPVTGEPVNRNLTTEYEGQLVAFCCGGCLAQFESDPESFAEAIEPLSSVEEGGG